MQLRYSGNIMPFEDSMKKVSAITWAPNGKKMAVAAADRVFIYVYFSLSIFLMKMERKKTNFRLSRQTKGKNPI